MNHPFNGEVGGKIEVKSRVGLLRVSLWGGRRLIGACATGRLCVWARPAVRRLFWSGDGAEPVLAGPGQSVPVVGSGAKMCRGSRQLLSEMKIHAILTATISVSWGIESLKGLLAFWLPACLAIDVSNESLAAWPLLSWVHHIMAHLSSILQRGCRRSLVQLWSPITLTSMMNEWIAGCQEQYLFACPGQAWLFFSPLFFNFCPIPPLPLNRNW